MGARVAACIPGECDLVEDSDVEKEEFVDIGGTELNDEKARETEWLNEAAEVDVEKEERSCESENAERSDDGGVAAIVSLSASARGQYRKLRHARIGSKREGISSREGNPSSPWKRPGVLAWDGPLDDDDDSGNL
jgi:hypothetical protein